MSMRCLLPGSLAFVALMLLGGLSPSAASACDAGAHATFGVSSGCFDQRISGAPTASNPAPDYFQAGGHPYSFEVRFNVNAPAVQDPSTEAPSPPEPLKSVEIELPPGLVANPSSAASCTMKELQFGDPETGNFEVLENAPLCPPGSQVGVASVDLNLFASVESISKIPLYYMGSPPGVLARFGFSVLGVPTLADAELVEDGSMRIALRSLNQGFTFLGASVTLWGSPADERHRSERSCPGRPSPAFSITPVTCPADMPQQAALLRLPTSCDGPMASSLMATSSFAPGAPISADVLSHRAPGIFGDPLDSGSYPAPYPGLGAPIWGPPQGLEHCDELRFRPSASIRLTDSVPQQPTGLEMSLSFPQEGLSDPEALAEADLRRAVIEFPGELSFNPSVARGLAGCSAEEAGFGRPTDSMGCPDAAKLGTFSVSSPLRREPVDGAVYMGRATDLEGDIELPIYLIATDAAIGLKLSGHVTVDEKSGATAAVLDGLPQMPIERMSLVFFGGDRAPFVTPDGCGEFEGLARFQSWAAGSTVASGVDFSTGPKGDQSSCAGPRLFRPSFEAGGVTAIAGAPTDLTVRVGRSDREQEFRAVNLTLPSGIAADLTAVDRCGDPQLAVAIVRSAAEEVRAPTCPLNSQVGNVNLELGAGKTPFRLTTGRLYLAGPLGDSPFSLAAVIPVSAGPLDLGTTSVRFAAQVNRRTGQLVLSGDLPTSLRGLRLRIRSLELRVDRPFFLSNPTGCGAKAIEGALSGSEGASASVSSPFGLLKCADLRFRPQVSAAWVGGPGATRRAARPGLAVKLKPRAGNSALDRAILRLPDSVQLNPAGIRQLCRPKQFSDERCPPGTVYGFADAKSPLLRGKLTGPVILKTSSKARFPVVAVRLAGEVDLDVFGRVRFKDGRIELALPSLPDLPLEQLRLRMRGGRHGLFVNSRDLCARKSHLEASLRAQNGRQLKLQTAVGASCRTGG